MSKKLLMITIGVIVLIILLVAIGIYLFLPGLHPSSNASVPPTETVTPTKTAKKTNELTLAIRQNKSAIESQVAEGLKLSPSQLVQQLKAGQTLTAISTTQAVSSSQLQTMLQNALNSSLKTQITAGTVTQAQINSYVTRSLKNPKALDKLLESVKASS